MLPDFDVARLALPTTVIFVVVAALTMRTTGSAWLALGLATLKSGLYVAYFGWLFDGTYTFLDDQTYLDLSAAMHAAGLGWSNLTETVVAATAVAGGSHFGYYLVNIAAIEWFGDGYYAPVAINVASTALTASVGTALARREGLCDNRTQATALFCLIAAHPDITAWSTVANAKDALVLLLHVMLLDAFSLHSHGRRWRALATAAAALAALATLRFYVSAMFLAALVVAAALPARGRAVQRTRVLVLVPAIAAVALLVPAGLWTIAADELRSRFVNPVFGFVRFLLTPVPFNTDRAFAFLDLPALVHWLLLPALLLGVREAWRLATPFARFLVAYALVFATLYAVYGELQGPRHRLQLDYAIALFQFLGLKALPRVASAWHARRGVADAVAPARGAASP